MPDDLRRFILTSVPSVPFVEAALLLLRQAGVSLDAPSIARNLYIGEAAAAQLASQLVETGIAEAVGGVAPSWRLAPRSKELERTLHLLAAYYASHLIEVTDLIHSADARKAQRFADAFKLKKDPS